MIFMSRAKEKLQTGNRAMKISRLNFLDQASFISGPQCAACYKKLSNRDLKTLKLSGNLQGRVQVNLWSFSKTSEKQKLLCKTLMSCPTKGREETITREASKVQRSSTAISNIVEKQNILIAKPYMK